MLMLTVAKLFCRKQNEAQIKKEKEIDEHCTK